MPRLPTLRLQPLADLLEQLRYAPREARMRQMTQTEALAAEITPGQHYPHTYIVFRLTGYRPDTAPTDEPIYAGDAVLVDLGVLVELLSDSLDLSRNDLGKPSLTLDELRRHWSVSSRTIDRYRRHGLIGHRVIDEEGDHRLVFTMRQVQHFEALHKTQLAGAQRFSRIDDDVEQRILRRARRYHSALGYSLNQTAARLSRRFDRGHETIRQLLARHDAEAGPDAVFTKPGVLTEKQRRTLHRAWRRGIPIDRLTRAYGRSRSSIHRTIGEYRAGLLRRLDLTGPTSPTFVRDDADSVILAPGSVRRNLAPAAFGTAQAFAAFAQANDLPEAEIEETQCAALHYLRYLAARESADLSRHQPSTVSLDQIETHLRWASRIKAALIASHARLALQTIEQFIGRPLLSMPGTEVRQLFDLSTTALSRAVDAHDVFKGGRLAAPAGLLLTRLLAAHVHRPADSLARARHDASAVVLSDYRFSLDPWQGWLELPTFLLGRMTVLDATERMVITARYGLDSAQPLTASTVADEIAATPQRVLRVERHAIRRLYGVQLA
ncbi:MAG: hypothetical protein KAS72_01705 [Phycisphaerales bacterium]|nr:hypothetical protein [Phycisphaerales bacterium]